MKKLLRHDEWILRYELGQWIFQPMIRDEEQEEREKRKREREELTTILSPVAISAIFLAHNSQFLILAALPLPIPEILVGVLTETKMISASRIALSISVEKKRFFPLTFSTISCKPIS
jgi:hypothetical protein